MAEPRQVAVIAAMGRDRVIGRQNQLPWRLPADMQRFRDLTRGHAVIMGRKTFESIGRPLPNRNNIVVTRQSAYQPDGVKVARSLQEALALCGDDPQPFVIGGEEIYRQALPFANMVYLTEVDVTIPDGDTHFPALDPAHWVATETIEGPVDAQNPLPHRYVTYRRR